ncbi:MAG TPA: HAD family phosphatase [Kiritimatiellia bacterium]|nr:HAD family phosphatase [Kiritimatiellia bacterium]HRZ12131.1 HAD family phosphatase [Kiritimatiellia bacterium]HSA18111.1 HAD family phosphatase [Kiritimatiellia bacterium]
MIRHLLFDIGGVLLNLDYGPAVERVLPLCDPALGLNSRSFFGLVERDPMLMDYERGRVPPEEFYRHFAKKAGYRGGYGEFVEAWYHVLSENRPMIEFARELAARRPITLASNAGVIHHPRMFRDFPSLGFRRGEVISCDIGAVKPERAFYERTLDRLGRRAEECLFLDDRPENVAGAEACGIRSILHTGAPSSIAAVRAALSEASR